MSGQVCHYGAHAVTLHDGAVFQGREQCGGRNKAANSSESQCSVLCRLRCILRARVEFGVAPVLAICNSVILLLLDWAECQGAITAIQ